MRFALLTLLLVACAPRGALISNQYQADAREGVRTMVSGQVPTARLGEVDEEGTAAVRRLLRTAFLSRYPEIRFVIDSPGGSVSLGLDILDAMKIVERSGTKITCVVDGMAASMAAVILQGCSERLMTRQSQIMFHTVSVSQASGNKWDLERLIKEMDSYNARLRNYITGRLCMDFKQYDLNTLDRDWWVGRQEALEICAVDGIVTER